MDIIAHALWGLIVFHELPLWWIVVLLSVLPDVVPFMLPYARYFFHKDILSRSKIFFSKVWKKKGDVQVHEVLGEMPSYVSKVYAYMHSILIWGAVFLVLFFTFREASYYILPWLLHIIIDIPSHGKESFPTPFLFPLSDFKVYGVPSTRLVFQVVNYSLILVVALIVF